VYGNPRVDLRRAWQIERLKDAVPCLVRDEAGRRFGSLKPPEGITVCVVPLRNEKEPPEPEIGTGRGSQTRMASKPLLRV